MKTKVNPVNMWWLSVLLLMAAPAFGRIRVTYKVPQIKPGHSYRVQSQNFPNMSEKDTKVTWDLRTDPSQKLVIACDDLRVTGMSPCGEDDRVTFRMDNKDTVVCGSPGNWTGATRSNTLTVKYEVGPLYSGGFLNCDITAIDLNAPDNLMSYVEEEYEDVDSSEDGGPAGTKSTTCPCGSANKKQSRIFGGEETKVHEFPWVVALTVLPDPSTQFCGGSLITHRHVITASHCTFDKGQYQLYVLIAEHNRESTTDTNRTRAIPVKKVVDHPKFVRETMMDDITILLLSQKVDFSTPFVRPVCLPASPLTKLAGENVKIIGWGRTPEYKDGSPFLQKVTLRALPKSTCHRLQFWRIPSGSPTHLCAWAPGKSACTGDSGGPVVWLDPETNRYTLVGLVSYGVAECGADVPRYNTDVNGYLDWIQKIIRETDPGESTCSKKN